MPTGSSLGSLAGQMAGTAFLGPLGGVAGGLIGGAFGGLFDDPEPEFQFQNYIDPGMNQGIRDMMGSRTGAQGAARLGARYRRDAKGAYEQIGSQYNGNPGVQAALWNRSQQGAQEGTTDAFIRGAGVDQASRAQGMQLHNQAQQYNLQRNAFEQGVFDMNNQPSFIDQAAQFGMAQGIGASMYDPWGGKGAPWEGQSNPFTGGGAGMRNQSSYGLDQFNQGNYGIMGGNNGYDPRRMGYSPASPF